MSSGLVGQVIDHFFPGTAGEKLLAIIIADNSTRNGAAMVSDLGNAELGRLSGQSEKNVRRLLAKFEAMGWLLVVQRSKGGHGRPTIYQINPDWVKLPIGWHGKQPGQNVPVEPGNNPDKMSGFSRETGGQNVRVVDPPPIGLKALPPVVPQFELQPDTGNGRHTELEDADLTAARWMLERLRSLNPQHREPRNWKRWSKEIRSLRGEVPGLTHRRICEVFRWANEDRTPRPGSDFCWSKQILSPGNLRAHWDRLALACDAAAASKPAAPAVEDRMCSTCRSRRWTTQIGKTGAKVCSSCAEALETAA